MRRVYVGISSFLCIFISLVTLSLASDAGGRIAFTRSEITEKGYRGSKGGWWELNRRNICIINPDGTGLKQLTDDGVSYGPKWSPDGSKIAFYSGPSSMVSLCVIDPDGSDRLELVPSKEKIYDFRWSPDATKIMVCVKTRRSRVPEGSWIVTVGDEATTKRMGNSEWAQGWNHWDPTGAKVLNPDRRLIDGLPEGVVWPEWSPDNKYIAFIHEGTLAIADTTVIGRPEKWRPSKLEPSCKKIGDWSPSGSKLLFFLGSFVWSINSDETGLVNLSMSRADDACWSPDESRIAFISTDGRKKNTEIYIMNADGAEQVQLTNTNYFHMDVDWR